MLLDEPFDRRRVEVQDGVITKVERPRVDRGALARLICELLARGRVGVGRHDAACVRAEGARLRVRRFAGGRLERASGGARLVLTLKERARSLRADGVRRARRQQASAARSIFSVEEPTMPSTVLVSKSWTTGPQGPTAGGTGFTPGVTGIGEYGVRMQLPAMQDSLAGSFMADEQPETEDVGTKQPVVIAWI